ncbi:MAG: PorT family protein [Lewinellaceae bacterium]|nr:PorT family protein [Lewinellaceae bacterium]
MKHLLLRHFAANFLTRSGKCSTQTWGKGGLNVYNIQNDNSTSNDPIVGFHLGLLGHIHLARQIAFQPEFVLSTQGAKYKGPDAGTTLDLAYINVPLLIQYMFDNGFRLQAGPQIGVLAAANQNLITGVRTRTIQQ